jgi:hypothetical protein
MRGRAARAVSHDRPFRLVAVVTDFRGVDFSGISGTGPGLAGLRVGLLNVSAAVTWLSRAFRDQAAVGCVSANPLSVAFRRA